MAGSGAPPREVKVVLLGDQGVGKSSLVLRFVTDNFKIHSETTIGASFMSKLVEADDGGGATNFKIWDTAGQEKYHSLAPMYYRGAAAAIVVYDITRESSFKTLQAWVNELKELGPENIVIAIAGNKADLADDRQVAIDAARDYAKSIGPDTLFVETSAKQDLNVSRLFTGLRERLPEQAAGGEAGNANAIDLGRRRNGPQGKGGCPC